MPYTPPDFSKDFAELRELVLSIRSKPGPAGKDGADGLPGAQGVQGPAGKDGRDADLARIRALEQELERLKGPFVAELYDTSGNLVRTVTFGPGRPLRIKLLPVK